MRLRISPTDLARVVDFAAEAATAQLVVVTGGEAVLDEVFDAEAVDVYAVQKGIVSVLFAMAAERGLLTIEDPVSDHLGSGWTRLDAASEATVRIRTVLDMTTGMDDELRPLGETGVTWRYDNISYNYLKLVLENATGHTLSELCRAWLFEPLGMSATRWVDRAATRPDGAPITGLESTARDLAAFGTMVLRGGQGVVSPAAIEALGHPGSRENPSWGLCWWNNDQAHHRLPRSEDVRRDGPVLPGAPADALVARGAMENRLVVVPSLDLVVARTAKPVARGTKPVPFDRRFWSLLLDGSDALDS